MVAQVCTNAEYTRVPHAKETGRRLCRWIEGSVLKDYFLLSHHVVSRKRFWSIIASNLQNQGRSSCLFSTKSVPRVPFSHLVHSSVPHERVFPLWSVIGDAEDMIPGMCLEYNSSSTSSEWMEGEGSVLQGYRPVPQCSVETWVLSDHRPGTTLAVNTSKYNFILKKRKTSAASTTDWMVETQLCKLRDTSDTFVGRAYSVLHL